MEIESYRNTERYIAITGNPLPQTWPHLADIDGVIDAVVAELDGVRNARQDKASQDNAQQDLDDEFAASADEEPASADDSGSTGADTGDAFLPDDLIELIEKGVPPQDDLSAAFHHAVCWLADCGWSADRIEARIAGKPIVPERYAKRLGQEIARCLHKRTGPTTPQPGENSNAMPPAAAWPSTTSTPTCQATPTSSCRPARCGRRAASTHACPRVPLLKKDGTPVVDKNGNPKHSKPSDWLDKHRPVEQMTWAPGEPLTVDGRLMAEGGWFERRGATTFNLYSPADVRQGNSANADRWVELVQRIYPNDADHIIAYCAHRIQQPAVKINHGVMLGGATGIGKDTMLEPLKLGVGPWNFKEVSPQDIMSNYNDYMQCVVLRISEAHDLGDINRYAFHDHMKTILATPPDVVRVNGKYMPQHYVLNVAGVIYTTNHRFDGVYLPPNDRRTYVAWSEILSDRFRQGFLDGLLGLVRGRRTGGRGRVPGGIRPLKVRSESAAEEDRGVLADRGSRRSAGKLRTGRRPRQAGRGGEGAGRRRQPLRPRRDNTQQGAGQGPG